MEPHDWHAQDLEDVIQPQEDFNDLMALQAVEPVAFTKAWQFNSGYESDPNEMFATPPDFHSMSQAVNGVGTKRASGSEEETEASDFDQGDPYYDPRHKKRKIVILPIGHRAHARNSGQQVSEVSSGSDISTETAFGEPSEADNEAFDQYLAAMQLQQGMPDDDYEPDTGNAESSSPGTASDRDSSAPPSNDTQQSEIDGQVSLGKGREAEMAEPTEGLFERSFKKTIVVDDSSDTDSEHESIAQVGRQKMSETQATHNNWVANVKVAEDFMHDAAHHAAKCSHKSGITFADGESITALPTKASTTSTKAGIRGHQGMNGDNHDSIDGLSARVVLSRHLRTSWALHAKVLHLLPNLPWKLTDAFQRFHTSDKPRYIIAVVITTWKVDLKSIHAAQRIPAIQEKEIVWMLGNRMTTVRTVWHFFHTRVMCDKERLFLLCNGLEKVGNNVEMQQLDYWNDRVVVFVADQKASLLPNISGGRRKEDGVDLLEELSAAPAKPAEVVDLTLGDD